MKNKYTETADKIRDLVPRLKEFNDFLSCYHGCDFDDECSYCDDPIGGSFGEGYDSETGEVYCYVCKKCIRKHFDQEYGLTLEDVLEALGIISNDSGFLPGSFGGYSDCHIKCSSHATDKSIACIEIKSDEAGQFDLCFWEYGKPFSEQSEECKDFITEILS